MFDKRLFILFLMALSSHLSAQTENGNKGPILKFDTDTVDFGYIVEGDSFVYQYWFTNTGDADLIIRQAYPACGCTYPSYTPGPIKPNERGVIRVAFHSKGFAGDTVLKSVIVINNGPERYAVFRAIIFEASQRALVEELNRKKEARQIRKKGRKRKS